MVHHTNKSWGTADSAMVGRQMNGKNTSPSKIAKEMDGKLWQVSCSVKGVERVDIPHLNTSLSDISRSPAQNGVKTLTLPPGPPRTGKWTHAEEEYAERVILDFDLGLLPIKPGATLRMCLSAMLKCSPMRISKKFIGRDCIGRRAFKPIEGESKARMKQASEERHTLEQRWLASLGVWDGAELVLADEGLNGKNDLPHNPTICAEGKGSDGGAEGKERVFSVAEESKGTRNFSDLVSGKRCFDIQNRKLHQCPERDSGEFFVCSGDRDKCQSTFHDDCHELKRRRIPIESFGKTIYHSSTTQTERLEFCSSRRRNSKSWERMQCKGGGTDHDKQEQDWDDHCTPYGMAHDPSQGPGFRLGGHFPHLGGSVPGGHCGGNEPRCVMKPSWWRHHSWVQQSTLKYYDATPVFCSSEQGGCELRKKDERKHRWKEDHHSSWPKDGEEACEDLVEPAVVPLKALRHICEPERHLSSLIPPYSRPFSPFPSQPLKRKRSDDSEGGEDDLQKIRPFRLKGATWPLTMRSFFDSGDHKSA